MLPCITQVASFFCLSCNFPSYPLSTSHSSLHLHRFSLTFHFFFPLPHGIFHQIVPKVKNSPTNQFLFFGNAEVPCTTLKHRNLPLLPSHIPLPRFLKLINHPHELLGSVGNSDIIGFALRPLFFQIVGKGLIPVANVFCRVKQGVTKEF